MADVQQLLAVDQSDCTPSWLFTALQAAIELEHATLPVYLTGLWSIEDQQGPAYDLIHSVIMEEMLHFGLACNMLTTIGGNPAIDSPGMVPKFPSMGLPHNVLPDLHIYLSGLTKALVCDVFMGIEKPIDSATSLLTVYKSIGEFYDAILANYKYLVSTGAVNITGDRQVEGPLNIYAITSVEEVEQAITEIKEQGEGTSTSPFDDPADFGGHGQQKELSHYYKFGEVCNGKRLKHDTVLKEWKYEGADVPWPAAFPVPPIPKGGYPPNPDVPALVEFDQLYSKLLGELHKTWNGEPGMLSTAIGTMMKLSGPAQTLMQTPLPAGSGNYGPCWRYVKEGSVPASEVPTPATCSVASPTWSDPISGYFTTTDVDHMSPWFNLADYASVKAHAVDIYARVANGTMPPSGAWSAERVACFKAWMAAGSPES